jgi:hypothetical protein
MLSDYLTFRKMITTTFIQIIFWVGVAAVVLMGLASMGESVIGGLLIIAFGPLIVRIYAELMIVIFRINDTLADIRSLLKEQNEEKAKRGM